VAPLRLAMWLLSAVAVAVAASVARGWAARRQRLAQRRWSAVHDLRVLTGVEFEQHVADTYRRMGYVTEMTPGSGDQGVDVIASRGRERIAIQCKQWADSVGNEAVQQVHTGMAYYRCDAGVVVTTSRFTASAIDLASRVDVRLVDGAEYAAMAQSVRIEPIQQSRPPLRWPSRRTLLYVGLAAGLTAVAAAYASTPRGTSVATSAVPPAICEVYPAPPGMAYYAYGGQRILAPAGGSCAVTTTAESTTIWVTVPDGAVTLESAPGCVACVLSASVPPGEQMVRLGPGSLAFEDPADVTGQGIPSGGPDPANGAIVTTPAHAAKATCTMPEAEHSLCTVILNTFLRDHSD
jgi:hypothetical protein